MNPLLSIVIPTKDHYQTLLPVLSWLLVDFKNLNVEIVVQDNTRENDEIRHFLEQITSKQLSYYHLAEPMPITQNCDIAVKNAKGKYLIMIGDDDYVISTIMDNVKYMVNENIDCLNSPTATYYWPDISFKYKTKLSQGHTLTFLKSFNKEYIELDAKKELVKVLNSGGTDYAELPRLYHGIVRKDILDEVYLKCKTYFPGPSPDMANSSALALYARKFFFFNFPFCISGKSKSSASGMGANHMHNGKLANIPFLDKSLIAKWNHKIPYFWSGDTIYAQSLYHSINACNYKASINFTYLYAHLLCFEYKNYKNIIPKCLELIKSSPFAFFKIPIYWIMINIGRLWFYFNRKTGIGLKLNSIDNVATIQDGAKYFLNL